MSKARTATPSAPSIPGYRLRTVAGDFAEYELKANGLRVIHRELPGTGVISTNLTYRVGSRHEARGTTGLAHMLEHMLFKPTAADIAANRRAGPDRFEAETGCLLNANTSRDRTTYYFSFPCPHLDRALAIEADRMQGVVITPENFAPERNNVLSEFDMYFSDPQFVLAMQMCGVTFHSHPYGHEVIGFRNDIERYTVEDLTTFYRTYYRPDTATLMVIGDTPRRAALTAVAQHFGACENPTLPALDTTITEAPPEGERTVTIERPSDRNILALGVRHAGFPSDAWHRAWLGLSAFADGADSILERALVDTGHAISVDLLIEPARDECLAIIFITLSPGVSHTDALAVVDAERQKLTSRALTSLVRKRAAGLRTEAAFTRASSLRTVAELTEYVAADALPAFLETDTIIDRCTPAAVTRDLTAMLAPQRRTLGYFIGTTTTS